MDRYRLPCGVFSAALAADALFLRRAILAVTQSRIPLCAVTAVTVTRVFFVPGRLVRVHTAGGAFTLPFAPAGFAKALCLAVGGEEAP